MDSWSPVNPNTVCDYLCAYLHSKRPIAHSQLGFPEFPTQTGIRFHAWPTKFWRIRMAHVRRPDRSCWNFSAGAVDGSLDRQPLAARERLCIFGRRRAERIFCVPATPIAARGEKERSSRRGALPLGGQVMRFKLTVQSYLKEHS